MNILDGSERVLPWCVLAVSALLVPPAALARAGHSDSWARDKYAAAERMHEVLNERPSAERSRQDYQRVIDAFRVVYFGAPASSKADPAVFAVAQLLTEMGQQFDDDKILHSAIEQYRFLRREYPGSKHRCDALFAIAEIYKDDLDQPHQARTAYEELLRRYPTHRLAPDARQALDEISQQSANKHTQSNKEVGKDPALRERRFSETAADEANHAQHRGDEKASADSAESKSGNIARVSGILHWSTPDYTRVAIELDQKVEFDAQRIDHPNRIFFDLQSTQLAPALAGRSFEVDDGILRRVRVAQFQADRTRVVLDVEDLSDYNSFVLSHPWRLMIDVRSKQSMSATNKEKNRLPTFPRLVGRGDAMPRAHNDLELAPQYPSKAVENRAPSKQGAVASGASKQFPSDDGQGRKSSQLPPPASQTGPVKKIVEADNDDEPDLSVTSLQPADLRPEITSAQKQSIVGRARPDQTAGDRNASDDPPRAGRPRRNSTALGEDSDVHEAKPTSKGDRSLIRALGLKIGRIVIDPGHGGHDTGTIGPNGLEEKDLVLGVAARLGKLLQSRLGSEVIYTRQDDTFIPLETRTAIANQEQADLFVSIHANSSRDPDARGVETYYLNFTSSPDALEVAARENAVSDKSIHELQDLVRKIALKEKIEESREFASDVQHALHAGLASKSPGIRDRGVRKAPFIVLIGANMPSILAEISFISNPTDERKLETAEYRQRIAESLYRGIAKYVAGLSGVKVASRMAGANNH